LCPARNSFNSNALEVFDLLDFHPPSHVDTFFVSPAAQFSHPQEPRLTRLQRRPPSALRLFHAKTTLPQPSSQSAVTVTCRCSTTAARGGRSLTAATGRITTSHRFTVFAAEIPGRRNCRRG